MSFATPLGLLALLAIPAVIFLHVFRRRFRQRKVAGLFLFAHDSIAADAGRQRTRLLRTPSLWLELLAALLLALWLGGFSAGVSGDVPHLVIVVDDSASMGARGAGGASAIDRVRAELRTILSETPARAKATLILTGPRPEIVVGPGAPVALLQDALDGLVPTQPSHDPAATLHMAQDIAGNEGRLLFFSDRVHRGIPERFRVRALGTPVPNAAVLSARRTGGKIFIDLMAWADAPIQTTLNVAGQDQRITLRPGRTLHVSLRDQAPRSPVVIRLANDALLIDNGLRLLPEPHRGVAVATLLGEQTNALLELEQLLRALPQVQRVSDPARAHLTFAPAPGKVGLGRTEVVLAAAGEETDAWVGPFLIERRHPLLSGLTLQGVVWTAGRDPLPGLPLVLAGARQLISEEASDGGTRITINLDPAHSNLPTSPDWPILVSNLVEHARARLPGAVAVNVRLGELISFRNAYGADAVLSLALVDPTGNRLPARGLSVLSWEPRRPGAYHLEKDGEVVARYSVHFVDSHESDLSGAHEATVEATTQAAGTSDSSGHLEAQVLALLLLAAVAADWWVLSRGRRA